MIHTQPATTNPLPSTLAQQLHVTTGFEKDRSFTTRRRELNAHRSLCTSVTPLKKGSGRLDLLAECFAPNSRPKTLIALGKKSVVARIQMRSIITPSNPPPPSFMGLGPVPVHKRAPPPGPSGSDFTALHPRSTPVHPNRNRRQSCLDRQGSTHPPL